ncbi:High-affinity nickel transport protein [Candidatus Sulfotelmatomonas gaucii]|uniref:Nickel/cobalt efflux system n=1 Tax=Candidatus Sulfuritelmatomonas gaucii TaxID=2043161 RepID=A0A2N9MAH9_9BACT|nr:High-affinity nickel transport protein [Candidatus Sulfotelmatomonas gaucii]
MLLQSAYVLLRQAVSVAVRGALAMSDLAAMSQTAPARRPALRSLFDDAPGNVRGKVVGIYAILFTLNAGAWLWAAIAFRHFPLLLGTGLLAYSFGLRHAVDADHIAAIDNVTRKLMQEGKWPVGVGFMFSLGHSTIVFLGTAGIAATALALQHRMDGARIVGGVIGTLVSSIFLFGIAAVNLIVLVSIYRAFTRVRNGAPYVDEDFDMLLANRGFLARLFRPMFALIRRSWHMYPLGVLFGLGFDTATEIGLLAISAAEASKGLPLWSILAFPALFAAGMSLIDTTDNILMLGAYGWAFIRPVRKLYYNITITFVSVVVALVVGGIEALGLLAGHFHLNGVFWNLVVRLNGNFATLGYVIVGFFALSWIVSIAIYKWRRLDDLELGVSP